MSKIGNGGTQKYCPNCEDVEVCTAVSLSSLGYKAGQRWHQPDHEDIQFFRRGLVCQNCGHQFVTAEVEEQFLDELVQLRDALKEIKVNAETYSQESIKASQALTKLSKSLKVLKALEMYKEV